MIGRRSFITGILGAASAPAIVKAESLMKIVVPRREILAPLEIGIMIGVIERFRIIVPPAIEGAFDEALRQSAASGSSGLSILLGADGRLSAKNVYLPELPGRGIHLTNHHPWRPS